MNCPTCDCEVFVGPSPCCCPNSFTRRLRIRPSNVVALLLTIGLCQLLISTPLTSLVDRIVSVPMSVVVYGAGWRYWVKATAPERGA